MRPVFITKPARSLALGAFFMTGCAGSLDSYDAVLVEKVDPSYPREAKAQGLEGYVLIGFDISKQGMPEGLRIIQSEPAGIFDQAALEAVRQWRYSPQLRFGRTVVTQNAEASLHFTIEIEPSLN